MGFIFLFFFFFSLCSLQHFSGPGNLCGQKISHKPEMLDIVAVVYSGWEKRPWHASSPFFFFSLSVLVTSKTLSCMVGKNW